MSNSTKVNFQIVCNWNSKQIYNIVYHQNFQLFYGDFEIPNEAEMKSCFHQNVNFLFYLRITQLKYDVCTVLGNLMSETLSKLLQMKIILFTNNTFRYKTRSFDRSPSRGRKTFLILPSFDLIVGKSFIQYRGGGQRMDSFQSRRTRKSATTRPRLKR